MVPQEREHVDIAADLKATLAARRELGPEMDDELVELFLARVDNYVASQVARQLDYRNNRRPERQRTRPILPGLPIPLIVLALFLFATSVGFGAHVHAFPPVALLLLIVVALWYRGSRADQGSRRV